jgi:hypothetical protein
MGSSDEDCFHLKLIFSAVGVPVPKAITPHNEALKFFNLL